MTHRTTDVASSGEKSCKRVTIGSRPVQLPVRLKAGQGAKRPGQTSHRGQSRRSGALSLERLKCIAPPHHMHLWRYTCAMTHVTGEITESTWRQVEQELRARDTDPTYADAPITDSYARISKTRGDERVEKVDRQTYDNLCRIRHRGDRLGEVLIDRSRSAWLENRKRPAWERLIERAESGAASGAELWRADRLNRQPWDLELLIKRAPRSYDVYASDGDCRFSDDDALAMMRVKTTMNWKQSCDTSARQRRKQKALRDEGKRGGGPRAFGEPGSYCGEVASEGQVKREREAIRWAVTEHIKDPKVVSIRAIAREWNARGLTTVRGYPWESRLVSQVLRSPRLTGAITYQGQRVGKLANFEPIITEDEHRILTRVFERRKTGRPASDEYLLSGGLLFCPCGKAMTGRAGSLRGKRVVRYACRAEGKGHVTIGRDPVEAIVRERTLETLLDPHRPEMIAQHDALAHQLAETLRKAQERLTEFSVRWGNEEVTDEEYEKVRPILARRLEEARANMDAMEIARTPGEWSTEGLASDLAERWESDSIDVRRDMVRQAFTRIVVQRPASTHQDPAERLEFVTRH